MKAESVSRRGFTARLAAFVSGISGLSIARSVSSASARAQEMGGVRKLDYDGKPASGTGWITPLILHDNLIYIAGQGAHSHSQGDFPMDIETHTTKVMDSVKALVEAGGGTMDSILQLTVYLTNIDNYDAMNKVFKTYFPHGGPARTCVAVAALPGQSLVEVNCIAAVTRK
jgi:2-iminobutanoate/2-iminopropanoate deaminase